ncbi:hypothetical protein ABVT39_005977 [Epinephelus coioides]
MELLPVVCLCLLTRCGITSADGNGPAVVKVEQDRDVILPCSLSSKENIESKLFDWKKPAQKGEEKKEVFLYDAGITYNDGRSGQSEEFKGRVSHFPGELKHGNASIIIRNTKMADSGDYTCVFPLLQPRQTFHIKLVVGAAREPSVKTLNQTNNWALLQCVVRDASPKPKVEWKDSSGNRLHAEEPQVTDRGGSYDIILQTTVTKTDRYQCVVTQEEINHQVSAETYVHFSGKPDISAYKGNDVTLHCSLSTEQNIESEMFEWKKDSLKEVFFYGGSHYNSNHPGQSEEFKGRVFHFPHKLKRGDASITIENAKMSDSGDYTCDFPRLQPRQTFHIKLDVVEKINPGSGAASHSSGPAVVTVEQDRDVILPCSLSTKENIESKLFDWKKPAQKDGKNKEVFFYDAGIHYNNGRPGQSEEFKGRVSHFQEELKHGNASIIIRNTKMADSGDYTCVFPLLQPRQTFHIKLVVGAAPKPNIDILDETDNRALLQCEVHGNPQPEVEWRDSAGKTLPAQKSQVSERDGRFYVTLNTTVTKTDRYRCVATQKNISHQIYAETSVRLNGAASKPSVKIVRQTKDGVLLQCEVSGASPKPKLEWKDSSGNKLPAEEPQVTDRGGSYDIILQTTVTKTDEYSCVVTQEEINHQISAETYVPISGFPIVAVVVSVLCTLLVGGVVLAVLVYKGCIPPNCNKGPAVVTVEQDRDVILPCSLSTKENIESKLFDWKKAAQKDGKNKEVFFYDAGIHYNNGRPGQSEEFKGRVSHFQEELKHGNASIIIRNTKMADSGDYTCVFPLLQPRQTFHIKLVVGAAPEPYIRSLDETKDWALLQCEVHGTPKPELQWQDSAGNILPAGEPQVSERDGRLYFTLNTTVTKSDRYRCVATQKEINHQISAETSVHISEPVVVTVTQDGDVILPCSLSTKENISQGFFDWNKVAQNNEKQKEVFLYDKGIHSNNGSGSQDEEFKGRVSHFQEELKHGNASIIIKNTKMADSGDYTCTFTEPGETFHIKLVVGPVLKDRSGENIPGAAPEPSVSILKQTEDGMLLQCVVRGASPKPKVQWKDSSGNKLPVDKPRVIIDRGDSYDIILLTTVTKTDDYHCVVTQEEINHQIEAKTFVPLSGAASEPYVSILEQTEDGMLLQCVVRGASPKPKVEWKDSSGNKLPAEEPQVTYRGGSYDIILQTTVTRTDYYHCVVTQEEINHQTEAKTFASLNDSTGWIVGIVVLAVVVIILVAVVIKLCITRNSNGDSEKRKPLNDSVSQSEQLQPPQTSPVI